MFKKTKYYHKYVAWFLLETDNPPRAKFIKAYTFKSKNAEKVRKMIKNKEDKKLTLSIIRPGSSYDNYVSSFEKKGDGIEHLGCI